MIGNTSERVQSLLNTADYSNCEGGHKDIENDVRLKNNLWRKSKLKKGTARLCTFTKDDVCGWEWEIDKSAGGVIGYPALEVGRSPLG